MRSAAVSDTQRDVLARRYREVRALTNMLCDPLSPEDMVVQVEACASPAKWHLAHTAWFFETFVLKAHSPGYTPYADHFDVLFNSYYHTVGTQHPRPRRGVLTRPGAGEVMAYRDTIDEQLMRLLDTNNGDTFARIAPIIELGLQHEQQHQELLLTDIKLLLHSNPLAPAYREGYDSPERLVDASEVSWIGFEGGVVEIGGAGEGFEYDNEGPRRRRFLEPFAIADRLVTNSEYLAFIEDGGYETPQLWLDEGWTRVRREGWARPLYWRRNADGSWHEYTLDGLRPLDPGAPACHISFFEADAFARWAGARLPTEAEWEYASESCEIDGNFVEGGLLHPSRAGAPCGSPRQMFGDVWEWTRSAHEPYPGYAPPSGAIGEYNGKFMCGTFVLRGGSCATSRSHIRRTYRNFFEPDARWQFAGVRLARSTS